MLLRSNTLKDRGNDTGFLQHCSSFQSPYYAVSRSCCLPRPASASWKWYPVDSGTTGTILQVFLQQAKFLTNFARYLESKSIMPPSFLFRLHLAALEVCLIGSSFNQLWSLINFSGIGLRRSELYLLQTWQKASSHCSFSHCHDQPIDHGYCAVFS